MYRLLEAAAAMRLTSGCHARCSSFVLKSMDVPSVGAPPGTAAASGAGAGLDPPFCSAARFALLPLDSPNLPCDCTHSAWASEPYMGLIDHAGSNSQHATALSTSSQDAKADRSRTSSSLQRKIWSSMGCSVVTTGCSGDVEVQALCFLFL